MCTSPNIMAFVGKKTYHEQGKSDDMWSFIPYSDHLDLNKIKDSFAYSIQVPCGNCLECKIQYAQAWADRCSIEASNSQHNYFITLTYDDFYLGDNSLDPVDLTLFIKRLRKHFHCGKDFKIKYFACGEYGGTTLRKHLHIILFNCPLTDLTFEFESMEFRKDEYGQVILDKKGNPIGDLKSYMFDESKDARYSPTIHKLWQYRGNITVQPFAYNRASYIARYCTGKLDKNLQEWYKEHNKHPEFIRMSQGIGLSGYDPEKLLISDSFIVEGTGRLTFQPRYFYKRYIKEFGDLHPDMIERKANNRSKRINTYFSRIGADKNAEAFAKAHRLNKRLKLKTQL